MGLFGKKASSKEQVVSDINLIKANTQQISVLMEYAKKSNEIYAKLEEIKEKLTYLNPVENAEVQKLDKKIGDKIGDIKIYLNKCDFSDKSIESLKKELNDLTILIIERNAKII